MLLGLEAVHSYAKRNLTTLDLNKRSVRQSVPGKQNRSEREMASWSGDCGKNVTFTHQGQTLTSTNSHAASEQLIMTCRTPRLIMTCRKPRLGGSAQAAAAAK